MAIVKKLVVASVSDLPAVSGGFLLCWIDVDSADEPGDHKCTQVPFKEILAVGESIREI